MRPLIIKESSKRCLDFAPFENVKQKLESTKNEFVCSACGIEAEFIPDGLIQCEQCKDASYCSIYCLQWDRERGNHSLCEGLKERQTEIRFDLPKHEWMWNSPRRVSRNFKIDELDPSKQETLESIKRLGSHLAECVLDFLVQKVSGEEDFVSNFNESSDFFCSDYSVDHQVIKASRSTGDIVEKLRQNRMVQAMDLSKHVRNSFTQRSSATNQTQLDYTRHTSAICLIDISGFTKLSQCLELDSLSLTINNYFQMILEEISAYGGDVLKFAGDAIFVEWQCSDSNSAKLRKEQAVLLASVCAAAIVKRCFDFPVDFNGTTVAMLNVHCGIGFGDVVGAHVGAYDRVEYVILGETIRQVSEASTSAKEGEVAASPEALDILVQSAAVEASGSDTSTPVIIACKSKQYFHCNIPKSTKTNCHDLLILKCREWSLAALERLQTYMSQYVHPVVVADEFSLETSAEHHAWREQCLISHAELRDVFTVFIQPQISVDLTVNNAIGFEVIQLLNEMMSIVNSEITRFKGHLRQFILDDKGLVIIANFGLRGSTFPNMIEERAMPCIMNIKTLLKTELATECRLGVTFGKAYCGVVGGMDRHEYAVLGPSVNLAARLMAYTDNPGILVDEVVKLKARCHPFQPLPPVTAKGYSNPVKIYKAQSLAKKSWTEKSESFVGREQELLLIKSLVVSILNNRSSKIALLSAPHGLGKSLLLAHGVEQIEKVCRGCSGRSHISCHVFHEEEAFQPFSIIRPVLRSLLQSELMDMSGTVVKFGDVEEDFNELNQAKLYALLLRICIDAQIPFRYVEIFGGLLFTNKLSDIGKWSDRYHRMSEWNKIIQAFVDAFLHWSKKYDLVTLALDNVAGMDEMSWKIVELLYERATNLFVIGACRRKYDMNVHTEFLEKLERFDKKSGRYTHVRLSPLNKNDISKLCCAMMEKDVSEIDGKVIQSVYVQSGGDPSLATEILEKLYRNKNESSTMFLAELDSGASEILLNRLDSLSPSARLHLKLGAIIGASFELDDLIIVSERYHRLSEEKNLFLADTVHQSLREAVDLGILDLNDCVSRTVCTFTHQFWMEKLLNVTLDTFKDDIVSLIHGGSESTTSLYSSDGSVQQDIFEFDLPLSF